MTSERDDHRDDDGGRTMDVTEPSRVPPSETPEQYGQRVARELLDKSFSSRRSGCDSE